VGSTDSESSGSPKDRIEAVHKDEYYRTYRLVLAYLALLDQMGYGLP
jgi:hypothetical protein